MRGEASAIAEERSAFDLVARQIFHTVSGGVLQEAPARHAACSLDSLRLLANGSAAALE
jgi:hypothetical protein